MRVPVRAAAELAAALKLTVPFPLPLAPDVSVIHESLLVDVQVQPEPAEMLIGVPGPPVASTAWLVGLIEAEHPPLCVTVNVWPAMVSVPVRGALERGAMLTLTV